MLFSSPIFLFLFFAGMGAGAADPEAFRILGAIGFALIVFMILMSVPGLVAGYGILKRRSWARVIGIVVGALDLPLFPIEVEGTVAEHHRVAALISFGFNSRQDLGFPGRPLGTLHVQRGGLWRGPHAG